MGRINRNRTKKRRGAALLPASLAVFTVLGAACGESGAYFTAYHTARWEQGLALGTETKLEEEYRNGRKTVVIENTGETECFVRVKAFAGSQTALSYEGSGWREGAGGCWYYDRVLQPAGSGAGSLTEPLDIIVGLPEPPGEWETFPEAVRNVVVIQESSQVFYREHNGSMEPWADFDLSASEEGKGDAE